MTVGKCFKTLEIHAKLLSTSSRPRLSLEHSHLGYMQKQQINRTKVRKMNTLLVSCTLEQYVRKYHATNLNNVIRLESLGIVL